MRPELRQAVTKLFKYLLITYAILSVIYTASYLVATYSGTSHDFGGLLPKARDAHAESDQQESLSTLTNEQQQQQQQQEQQQLGDHSVAWSNAHGAVQVLPENLIMSKVFSEAMGPSNMTPYFFRAKETFDKEDITMSTLVTRNRFLVLSRLASNYKGPISATVHVMDDETKDEVITELQELHSSNPDMQKYVDLHLIVDQYDRQFNMWRNVAKLFARTDYIMMLDVDFHLCTDLRKSIRGNPEIMDRLREGRTALVVPAFEFDNLDDGNDWRTFPTKKDELMELVQEDKIGMFHKGWFKGHGSTNYTKWYETDDLYKVTRYDFSYEPYIIYKKEGSPWCEERFVGYGANKAACLYEIFLSGIEYWVLPNDFLIHQTHRYPEDARRKERQYNRKLYINYREEVCLRYARKFHASGEWHTSRADNLKGECEKIRGFKKTMMSTIN